MIGVTPDPTKVGGGTYMLVFNQENVLREQIISVEKVGNNFEVIYIHDTNKQGSTCYASIWFLDENQNIPFGGEGEASVTNVARQYIGKFDLAGQSKHVFIQ